MAARRDTIEHVTLCELATERLREARALQAASLHDGALYLAGYVLELALKACVCKRLGSSVYPPLLLGDGKLREGFFTHSLTDLIIVAGLTTAFSARIDEVDGLFGANYNMVIVGGWSEKLRYRPLGTDRATEAEEFLNALDDPAHGVFTWLKTQW